MSKWKEIVHMNEMMGSNCKYWLKFSERLVSLKLANVLIKIFEDPPCPTWSKKDPLPGVSEPRIFIISW